MPTPLPQNYDFAYAGQFWRWRRRGQQEWHSGHVTHEDAVAAALADEATLAQAAATPPEATPEEVATDQPPGKGHWRKGRSRNLDPAQIAMARALTELLAAAIDRPWRHPTLGTLSYRVVAAHLGVDHSTVRRWCKSVDRPPAWALPRLRGLLKEFQR